MRLLFLVLLILAELCQAKGRDQSTLMEDCMAGLTGENYRTVGIFKTGPILQRVRALTEVKSVLLLSDRNEKNGSHTLVVRPISAKSIRGLGQNPVSINETELVEVVLNKTDYTAFKRSRKSIGSVRASLSFDVGEPQLNDVTISEIRNGTVIRIEDFHGGDPIDVLVIGKNSELVTTEYLKSQGALVTQSFQILLFYDGAKVGARANRLHRLDVADDLLWFDGTNEGDSFFYLGRVNYELKAGVARILDWTDNQFESSREILNRGLTISSPRIPRKRP